jgi:hypothetical protein
LTDNRAVAVASFYSVNNVCISTVFARVVISDQRSARFISALSFPAEDNTAIGLPPKEVQASGFENPGN